MSILDMSTGNQQVNPPFRAPNKFYSAPQDIDPDETQLEQLRSLHDELRDAYQVYFTADDACCAARNHMDDARKALSNLPSKANPDVRKKLEAEFSVIKDEYNGTVLTYDKTVTRFREIWRDLRLKENTIRSLTGDQPEDMGDVTLDPTFQPPPGPGSLPSMSTPAQTRSRSQMGMIEGGATGGPSGISDPTYSTEGYTGVAQETPLVSQDEYNKLLAKYELLQADKEAASHRALQSEHNEARLRKEATDNRKYFDDCLKYVAHQEPDLARDVAQMRADASRPLGARTRIPVTPQPRVASRSNSPAFTQAFPQGLGTRPQPQYPPTPVRQQPQTQQGMSPIPLRQPHTRTPQQPPRPPPQQPPQPPPQQPLPQQPQPQPQQQPPAGLGQGMGLPQQVGPQVGAAFIPHNPAYLPQNPAYQAPQVLPNVHPVSGNQLVHIPEYDGTADIENWLASVDRAQNQFLWSEEHTALAVMGRLRGDAQRWLRAQEYQGMAGMNRWKYPANPVDSLRYKMKDRFSAAKNRRSATQAFQSLKKRPNERVQAFYDRVVIALNDKNHDVDETTKRTLFYRTAFQRDLLIFFSAVFPKTIR